MCESMWWHKCMQWMKAFMFKRIAFDICWLWENFCAKTLNLVIESLLDFRISSCTIWALEQKNAKIQQMHMLIHVVLACKFQCIDDCYLSFVWASSNTEVFQRVALSHFLVLLEELINWGFLWWNQKTLNEFERSSFGCLVSNCNLGWIRKTSDQKKLFRRFFKSSGQKSLFQNNSLISDMSTNSEEWQ